MSSPLKKRKHDEEAEDEANTDDKRAKDDEDIDEEVDDVSEDSEEDSDLESDDSEGDEFTDKEIHIDFSAYQVLDEDFNGIKCLLQQLWLKESIDISQLSQLLVDQSAICSVLKQEEVEDEEEVEALDDEEDYDVYGVTSVIPLTSYADNECIKQIRNILTTYTPKTNQIHKLLSTESSKIGLIVNERFSNLPPKISLPSYQQLFSDLKAAKRDKHVKLDLDFDWYLMVCKVLKPKANDTSKKSSESDQSATTDPSVTYVNAEEEIFDEESDERFEYSVAKQCDADVYDWKNEDNLLEPFRKLLLLSTQSWSKAIERLAEEFK